MSLLIIKTGSTVPSVLSRRRDFEVWITTATGMDPGQVVTVSVHQDEALPEPGAIAGAIVTGSPSMVTEREPWSLRTEAWLRDAVEHTLPVLGICYGHQLLAQALGGTVGDNPRGRSIGTVDVQLDQRARQDALFGLFPEILHVPVSHVQSVLELPEGARRLGYTDKDPNHVFSYGDAAWGVQFHPEFDAAIVRDYIDARRSTIEEEGLEPEQLKADAIDSPDGTVLLRRFAALLR